jgi:nitroimidazol reductase NimA-like FMN-containing flavoprotein (pyridoxamine 5'-phosphate oxidase superfamily)
MDVSQRELERLSHQECLELLGQQSVGRLIYQDEIGPIGEPVNYAVAADTIVLRIEGGTKRQAITQPVLAFEVDRIDPDHKAGWSVIARGVGQEVPPDEVVALLHQLRQAGVDPPRPWASGIHNIWLTITIHTLSGRKLGRDSSPLVF